MFGGERGIPQATLRKSAGIRRFLRKRLSTSLLSSFGLCHYYRRTSLACRCFRPNVTQNDPRCGRKMAAETIMVPETEDALLTRITTNPEIFGGKPIIRGRRLAVEHVLGMLAAGDTSETILKGYAWLEPEDVRACLVYARRVVGQERIEPALTNR